MTDEFIHYLRADWRAQETESGERLLARLRRGRRTARVRVWLVIVQGLLGLAAGATFLWFAARSDLLVLLIELFERLPGFPDVPREYVTEVLHPMIAPLFWVSGALLLVVQPIATWMLVQARRASLCRWVDETPERLLRYGVRRAAASLRANRIGRLVLWLFLALVAVLWLLVAVRSFPAVVAGVLTAAYLVAILVVWLWLDLQRERLRREIETCLRLLEPLEGRDAGEPPP